MGALLSLCVKETSTTAQALLGGGRRDRASLSRATFPASALLYALPFGGGGGGGAVFFRGGDFGLDSGHEPCSSSSGSFLDSSSCSMSLVRRKSALARSFLASRSSLTFSSTAREAEVASYGNTEFGNVIFAC